MKSLLKISFICLLSLFTTNVIHAQCSVNMYIQKVGEDASSVTYRIQASTPNVVDRITLLNNNQNCSNTRFCHGYKTISKGCSPKNFTFECEVLEGNCIKRDGCIIVIDPISGC